MLTRKHISLFMKSGCFPRREVLAHKALIFLDGGDSSRVGVRESCIIQLVRRRRSWNSTAGWEEGKQEMRRERGSRDGRRPSAQGSGCSARSRYSKVSADFSREPGKEGSASRFMGTQRKHRALQEPQGTKVKNCCLQRSRSSDEGYGLQNPWTNGVRGAGPT